MFGLPNEKDRLTPWMAGLLAIRSAVTGHPEALGPPRFAPRFASGRRLIARGVDVSVVVIVRNLSAPQSPVKQAFRGAPHG